jgi:hypothetical protein
MRQPKKRKQKRNRRSMGRGAAAASVFPPGPSAQQLAKDAAQQANKIFPRNLTAQAAYMIAGNPVVTRPEDAVANCFPGLEVDIRNLDRRFFPGLVFDFIEDGARLAYVDVFEDPDLTQDTPEAQSLYLKLSDDNVQATLSAGHWYLDQIEQNGKRLSMDWQGSPLPDTSAWRVVRSLELGPVTIRLKRRETGSARKAGRRERTMTLKGWRRRYMDAKTGVLNGAYQPGELMQGLCSPWQHDFRDCACFYWAANHPDIVLGEIYPGEKVPAPGQANDPQAAPPEDFVSDVPLDWLRVDRTRAMSVEAKATISDNRPYQIDHFQVNHIWQDLSVVIGGREIGGLYVPETIYTANPYKSPDELASELSTKLAPLEIALTFEYLFARFSLLDENEARGNDMLRDAVLLARERMLLIAASEMQHLRWVNQMLWDLRQAGLIKNFAPVLVPATEVPTSTAMTVDRDFDSVLSAQSTPSDRKANRAKAVRQYTMEVRSAGVGGMHRLDKFRPVQLRPLTPDALMDFIAVEHPSAYLDSAYARVIATLTQRRQQRYPESTAELAERIAADGVQHETRFREIKDALSPFFLGLSYVRKDFREGTKTEGRRAIEPLRTIKDSLRGAYQAASDNQLARSAEKIVVARTAMNDLLSIGEELAARKHIGIPFFKIWKDLS